MQHAVGFSRRHSCDANLSVMGRPDLVGGRTDLPGFLRAYKRKDRTKNLTLQDVSILRGIIP
jgi:hypothetical protein